MKIAFEYKSVSFFYYFEFLIDVSFIIDLFLNLNTGFYLKDQLIMKRDLIVKDYLKQWFWIDLASSLPYTWILAASQGINIRTIEENESLPPAMASTP